MDATLRPVRAESALDAEVLDDLVVYSHETSSAVSLNESARAIWTLCDGGHTVDDICAELSQAAGVAPDAIRPDVIAAVQRLQALGLVRRAD